MKKFSALLLVACVANPLPAHSSNLIEAHVKERANAVLGLMAFALTPDVTTGSLSITDTPTDNPDVSMSTLGGGFTVSQSFPLYLEGTAGYSRYDPTFLVTEGQAEREIPTRWNNISATGGVGWDFSVAKELKLRPIFNFSFGRVTSDAAVASTILEAKKDQEIEFLDNGKLDVLGLGGTLMLDYERYREKNEIDVELRYTNIVLQGYNAPGALQGSFQSQSLSLWSRWRAPTGIRMLKNPLRYVLEAAHTSYIGDMRGALGFDALNSLGAGLELDSSAYIDFISRTRVVFRYQFGDNVEGTSVGIAVSF